MQLGQPKNVGKVPQVFLQCTSYLASTNEAIYYLFVHQHGGLLLISKISDEIAVYILRAALTCRQLFHH